MQAARDGFQRGRTGAAAAGHGQQVRLVAVGAHDSGKQAVGVFAVLKDCRAGPVAKENTGVAVFPVDDGREFFRADDQDGLIGAGEDELLADFHRVNEA